MAGRKRVLTPNLVSELAANLAAHGSIEAACAETGVSARSVRRWRAEGRRELDGLSAEAQLALVLGRAERARRRGNGDGWREAARRLEELGSLDDLLAQWDN